MADVSIQLQTMRVGGTALPTDEIASAQQDIAKQNLLRIILQYIDPNKASGPVKFRLSLEPERVCLYIHGQDPILVEKSVTKRIERVVQFCEHMGQVPTQKYNEDQIDNLADLNAITENRIKEVRAANLAGSSTPLVITRIAQESLDMSRSIGFSIFGSDNQFISHLGYFAGILWAFFAMRDMNGGTADETQALNISDAEGIRRAKARQLSGSICTAASLTYLLGRAFDTFSVNGAAGVAFNAANGMFGISSLVAMGLSLLGIFRCSRFQDRLNEYLEADSEKFDEPTRLKAALKFLKNQVTVTPRELDAITRRIEQTHSDINEDEKNALIEQAVYDLTEVKVKYMKRRTSNQSLKMILEQTQTDELMAKLERNDSNAIEETRAFFHEIKKESRKKMTLYMLGFLCAALSLAACIILTFFSLGTLPFILYGISGTICLLISLYNSGPWIMDQLKNYLPCMPNRSVSVS